MEGCIKPSRHESEVATRNTKAPSNRRCDQGRVAETEGTFKEESEVATPNEDNTGRDINLRPRHETKTKGLYMEGFQVATKCKLKKQREVTTNHSGRNYI